MTDQFPMKTESLEARLQTLEARIEEATRTVKHYSILECTFLAAFCLALLTFLVEKYLF